jgi:hypothetical protein
MRIKKMYQGTVPENKILNTYSDSQTDVYSCNFLNGKTIYDNTDGSNGNITLSESIEDASSILIEYKCNTYGYKTEKILNPNGKDIILDYLTVANATVLQNASSKWFISGKNMELVNSCMINSYINGTFNIEQGNQLIYITKVIKYKI